jgi:hypothetical protein
MEKASGRIHGWRHGTSTLLWTYGSKHVHVGSAAKSHYFCWILGAIHDVRVSEEPAEHHGTNIGSQGSAIVFARQLLLLHNTTAFRAALVLATTARGWANVSERKARAVIACIQAKNPAEVN